MPSHAKASKDSFRTRFARRRLVGRLGFEPRTNCLKGKCSTIELSPQLGPRAQIVFRLGGKARIICIGRPAGRPAKRALTAGPGVVQSTGQLATFVGTILKFPDQSEPDPMTAKAQ